MNKLFPMIVILMTLVGCDQISKATTEAKFHLISCDRNGCIKLMEFSDVIDCDSLRFKLQNLHLKVMHDKPGKVLMCYDNFSKRLDEL